MHNFNRRKQSIPDAAIPQTCVYLFQHSFPFSDIRNGPVISYPNTKNKKIIIQKKKNNLQFGSMLLYYSRGIIIIARLFS